MLHDIAFGIIIGFIFISIIVLFCVLLVKLYIKKIKEHNQKELAFQKTLTETIIETQEQLLTSISQDLHDDAGQQLTVINFQLENLKIDNPTIKKELLPISQSVTKLSQSLRDISHSLNANWLDKNGLIDAIKKEINRLQKNKTIAVNLKVTYFEKNFKNEEQIVLFRIFQEVINNILKHAKATKIDVYIDTIPVFKITIQDNGEGFDKNKLSQETNSIGIQNCINRAKMIQYNFEITSQPTKGTTVILEENK